MSGTGPPRGESFRADVAARVWVHILCETPLWEQFPGGAYPVAFQLEADEHTDDILVRTSAPGRIFVQCKRKVSLSDKQNSPFGSAIAQFVTQFQNETLTVGCDWLVLAYSEAAGNLDKVHEILARFRDGTPSRAEALLNGTEKKRFEVLERAIRNAWRPAGASPTWDELAHLARMLRFVELRIGPEHRCEIDPYRWLERLLMRPMDHAHAVTELRDQCLTSAGLRGFQDAQGGRALLRSKTIRLREPQSLRDDWAQLRRISDEAVKELYDRGRLRWGNQLLHVPRCEMLEKLELELRSASLVMAGAPGDGKSSLLAELATKLRHDGRQVVLLRPGDIAGVSSDAIRTDLKLTHRLEEILADAADPLPAYLLVDALELTHTNKDCEAVWRKLMAVAKEDTARWRVIASIRHSALDHSSGWKELFDGRPIGNPSSSATTKVRHVVVPPFTAAEQEVLFRPLPRVWEALCVAPIATKQLLATPFNLRLMMDSSTPETFVANKITSQHALLDAYWTARVLDTSDPSGRAHALRELASRSTQVITFAQLVAKSVAATAIDALVFDGVLRRDPKSLHVAFFHDLIEEYALSLRLDDDLAGLTDFLAKPGVA